MRKLILIIIIFVFKLSDAQTINWTEQELRSKNLEELKILRNEFYARKGYVFNSKKLNDYFRTKTWYHPQKNADIIFSKEEKNNIDLITKFEGIEKAKNIDLSIVSFDGENPKFQKRDTVFINYHNNKPILESLSLLPEANMGSWSWSQKERTKIVSAIRKYGFVVDTNPYYFNISSISEYDFSMQIVDGSWNLSLLPIDENKSILIAQDSVGDGVSISVYKKEGKKLIPTRFSTIFDKNLLDKLLKNKSAKCKELLIESYFFDYDFDTDNLVLSTWQINKEESDCFKGNAMRLKFNKQKERFEFEKIFWK